MRLAVGLYVLSEILTALFFIVMLAPYATHAAEVTITMTDNQFSPRNITINAGDTITWINRGSAAHTATADTGAFDTGSVAAGGSSSAIFNSSGTYAYHCKFHGGTNGSGMAGTITVRESTANSGTTIS